MTRAHWAALANEAARLSRRGGAPHLTADSSRATIIHWLQWNDPNGAHTDRLAQVEDIEPYTLDTAWAALAEMIQSS